MALQLLESGVLGRTGGSVRRGRKACGAQNGFDRKGSWDNKGVYGKMAIYKLAVVCS